MRGGSWINDADNCRAAYRNRNRADDDNNDNGLRACLAPSTTSPNQATHRRAVEAKSSRKRDIQCPVRPFQGEVESYLSPSLREGR
jgi:hypothetical protein